MFCFLFLAPYARTTRYEEAFLPEGKERPRSLPSLGLAIFRFFPDFVLFDGFISKFLVCIQLAKLSFNYSHGRTHSCRFSTFYKKVEKRQL